MKVLRNASGSKIAKIAAEKEVLNDTTFDFSSVFLLRRIRHVYLVPRGSFADRESS